MDLIGQPIRHIAFGPGVVTNLAENIMTVCFQDSEKKFLYPDAFDRFLVVEDLKVRRWIEKQLQEQKTAAHRAKLKKLAEQERNSKLLNFKVTLNSHAAFNLVPEEIESAVQAHRVSAGTYLSGCAKGQPRVLDRLKPNSLCLLTARPAGQPEEERKILAVFMVKEDFFGEDVSDGIIEGHLQHRILIPKEHGLPFWPYLKDVFPRWGSTAYKYCSCEAAGRVLSDLAERPACAAQKDTILDLYRYFCERNHLRAPAEPKTGKSTVR